MKRKGWFKIKGVQDGDRTVAQQLAGLERMLAQVAGKTVLDLGCAEGLISNECLRAGATAVTGVELVKVAVLEAINQCPEGRFICEDLDPFVAREAPRVDAWAFDIVLALAILHKLRHPGAAVEFIAQAARSLAVIRTAGATPGYVQDLRSARKKYDVVRMMQARSFVLATVENGPFNEWTGYFVKE